MSIKKWLLSLVASAFMVTAVFANDDDDKVFSLPFYSVLCPYPILKNLPKCDAFIKLNGHSDWVKSVVFSPDSQFLASSSDDRTIKIWDPNTGKLLRTLEGHLTVLHQSLLVQSVKTANNFLHQDHGIKQSKFGTQIPEST